MNKTETRFSLISNSIFLLSILLIAYILTYSGTFTTDDEHILASRTLSMAFDDEITDYRVLGNTRIYRYFILDPEYGEQSLNIEPMQAILATPLAKLSNTFQLGKIHTIFLLNIFLTALTALAIFWTLIFTGNKYKTAMLTSLLFGLCSIAWPYSRTYFRDVSAMLFVTLAWGTAMILTSERKSITFSKLSTILLWLGLGLTLLLGILSKNSVLLVIPALILLLIRNKQVNNIEILRIFWKEKRKKIVFTFILFIFLIIYWLFLPHQSGILSRFTPFYYFTVLRNIFNQEHSSLVEGLIGPFFSPGKSVFLYSPILILAVIALIKSLRKSYYYWLYFILLVIAQALYYDSNWWGSVNWGLRFLLPAIPILMLASAPVIETILEKKNIFPLASLAIISFIVQIIGIWVPVREYYIAIAKSPQQISQAQLLWNPKFSHLWWNSTQIISGDSPDSAALRVGFMMLPIIITFVIFLVFIALLLMWKKSTPKLAISVIFIVFVLMGIYLFQLKNDPAYFPRNDLVKSHDYIKESYSPQDIIFIRSYATPAWYYWMNWSDPDMTWISLSIPIHDSIPANHSSLFQGSKGFGNGIEEHFFDHLLMTYRNIWLVSPNDSFGEALQLDAISNIFNITNTLSWESQSLDFSTKVFLFHIP